MRFPLDFLTGYEPGRCLFVNVLYLRILLSLHLRLISNSPLDLWPDILPLTDLFLAIYVDDLLLLASDKSRFIDTQDQLSARFKMSNWGEVYYYLGMEVDVEVGRQISFRQTVYLKKILDCFQMTNCKPVSIPINPGVANSLLPSDQQAN